MPTPYTDLANLIPRSRQRTWKEIDSATFAFRHMVKVLAEELQFPRESMRMLRNLENKVIESDAYGTKRSDVRNASEGYYFDFIIKIPPQPTDCTTFAIRFTYRILRQQEPRNFFSMGSKSRNPLVTRSSQWLRRRRERQPSG